MRGFLTNKDICVEPSEEDRDGDPFTVQLQFWRGVAGGGRGPVLELVTSRPSRRSEQLVLRPITALTNLLFKKLN